MTIKKGKGAIEFEVHTKTGTSKRVLKGFSPEPLDTGDPERDRVVDSAASIYGTFIQIIGPLIDEGRLTKEEAGCYGHVFGIALRTVVEVGCKIPIEDVVNRVADVLGKHDKDIPSWVIDQMRKSTKTTIQ